MTDFYMTAAVGGERIDLNSGKSRLLVGRHPDCDILLTEGHPSRKHASLTARQDGVWLQDLGSVNGTFVNGSRIESGILLKVGDTVSFDTAVFHIGSDCAQENSMAEVDPDATVLHPAATSVATSTESVAAPEASARAPESWADPEYQNKEGTVIVTNKDLEDMLEGLPADVSDEEGPCLAVLSGSCKGKSFRLVGNQQTNQWEIGSEDSRDIVIDDEGVSAFHAKLVNERDRWKLIDQMSANGTWVNQQKSNICYLQSGDRIRFAAVECQISLPGVAGSKGSADQSKANRRRYPWLIATVAFVVTLSVIYAVMRWLV